MARLTELIQEEPGSKLSSSRLWFNIANTASTIVFLYASFKASQHIPINLDGLTWYTLVYMGVVTSNKFANKFVDKKYGTSEQKTP